MAIPAFLKKLSVVGAGAVFMALGTMASAQAGILGGKIISTGGNAKVEVLDSDADFTSELGLYDPATFTLITSIATNKQVGTVVDLGNFIAGQELLFGIRVWETGDTFFTGPGSRNADGLEHNMTHELAQGVIQVGFEDVLFGGDFDYDDVNFKFTGAIDDNTTPVPEPASIAGLIAVGALATRLKGAQKKA